MGREEEERPLTPDQGQVGGEHSLFFVMISPLRRLALARPFRCKCTSSSRFSANYCSLVFQPVSTQRRTAFLLELCMFVCWFHYRSRCLRWNNGALPSVIMGWILSLLKEMMSTLGSFHSA